MDCRTVLLINDKAITYEEVRFAVADGYKNRYTNNAVQQLIIRIFRLCKSQGNLQDPRLLHWLDKDLVLVQYFLVYPFKLMACLD